MSTMWFIPLKLETEDLINTKDTLERYIDSPYQTFGTQIHTYYKNVKSRKLSKFGKEVGVINFLIY